MKHGKFTLVAGLHIDSFYYGSVIGDFEFDYDKKTELDDQTKLTINDFFYNSMQHWALHFENMRDPVDDVFIESLYPNETHAKLMLSEPIIVGFTESVREGYERYRQVAVEVSIESVQGFVVNQTVGAEEFQLHYGMPKIAWLWGSNTARYPKWVQDWVKSGMTRHEYSGYEAWFSYGVMDGPGMLQRIDDDDWYMKAQMGWDDFEQQADDQEEQDRQRIEELVDIVDAAVKAHAGEIAQVTAQVANDTAKELGYESASAGLLAAAKSTMARLRLDRALSWTQGKVAGLFAPKEDPKLLSWRSKK